MARVPVYFIPGFAASPSIFEYINLPEDQFICYRLSWILPTNAESLSDYAKRYAVKIEHQNAILIGCSFGGILAQELKTYVKPLKIIIISSVKCRGELPPYFRLAGRVRFFKLLPVYLLVHIDKLHRYRINRYINERLRLYKKYMAIKDRVYWNWAIRELLSWSRETPDQDVIHIHGDRDEVFPVKYLTGYIPVSGGTHVMVIKRHRWFTERLPEILLKE
jgi:pimeloyl-ACP methyl ester carboxylesterase